MGEAAACGRCGKAVGAGELLEHAGASVCEDCLMELMNPARACDPWAVKLAKGASKTEADAVASLQGLEKALYELVRKRGRVPRAEAPGLLDATADQVARAFAVLRHMELLRGDRGPGGGVDLVPFAKEG